VEDAAVGRPVGGIGIYRGDFAHERPAAAQKNELKPWLKKRWCIGKITSEFLWPMEDVLNQSEVD
jgi:hypothetical protein